MTVGRAGDVHARGTFAAKIVDKGIVETGFSEPVGAMPMRKSGMSARTVIGAWAACAALLAGAVVVGPGHGG